MPAKRKTGARKVRKSKKAKAAHVTTAKHKKVVAECSKLKKALKKAHKDLAKEKKGGVKKSAKRKSGAKRKAGSKRRGRPAKKK